MHFFLFLCPSFFGPLSLVSLGKMLRLAFFQGFLDAEGDIVASSFLCPLQPLFLFDDFESKSCASPAPAQRIDTVPSTHSRSQNVVDQQRKCLQNCWRVVHGQFRFFPEQRWR